MNTADADGGFKYNDSASFTPVVRKRKKRRNPPGVRAPTTRSPTESVERTMAELRADSHWMENCTQIIRDAAATLPAEIDSILCLGLGSATESAQARFQLCFLLELRDTILPNPVRICAFDPVFSFEDILLLTSLGVQILPDNKQGKYELEGGTLAFMPHCDRELYENFLRSNWCAASLADLLLIGNDLRRYAESTPARVLGAESPCVSRLAPLVASTHLPEHHAYPNAFSSTAVQHISAASLASQLSCFWELAEEDPIRGGHGEGSEGNGVK